jgi:hypothetical protein
MLVLLSCVAITGGMEINAWQDTMDESLMKRGCNIVPICNLYNKAMKSSEKLLCLCLMLIIFGIGQVQFLIWTSTHQWTSRFGWSP